ncbi:hypothetical protein LTR53_000785 [Teratosphaeriaceae sp. CCFEE 6253]|nr:hypothetical protein LTR53_000785 [Teratosphaeriaceae sp. CCFEE 6253]
MALKRKRSSFSFSSPAPAYTSTTADTSSPAIPYYYPPHKPAPPMEEKPTWSFPTFDDSPASQHLNSRTRKRHRDDRPDEQQVYGGSCWIGAVVDVSTLADVCRAAASTISRLYDAQRRHPDAAPAMSNQTASVVGVQEQPQKSTLHAFWRLPAGPVRVDEMQIDPRSVLPDAQALQCDDCDRPLRHDNAMDLEDAWIRRGITVVRDGLTIGPSSPLQPPSPKSADFPAVQ